MHRLLASSALLLALAAPAPAQDATPAPTLRAHVVVDGELVRIGDLVDHAGAAAGIAVFRAPDLGQTGSVAASRIVEALRAHQVIAVDLKGLKEINVTRAAEAFASADAEARIAAALSAQYRFGEPGNIGVQFDRGFAALHVEPGRARDIVLSRLVFDPRSKRFDASLELPGGSRPLRLTGIAAEMTDVVTLSRPLVRGDVLRQADLLVERRPKSDATAEALADAKAVIGFAVRTTLRAGAALRRADLMKPELVGRNEQVTLIYEVPGMTLTVRGTAQDGGSEGDVVNVLNPQSKRVVQGVVTGAGRVVVTTLAPRIISQSSKQSVASLNDARRNAQ